VSAPARHQPSGAPALTRPEAHPAPCRPTRGRSAEASRPRAQPPSRCSPTPPPPSLAPAAVEGQLHALVEAEGEEARRGSVGKALQAELSRSVVVIGQLAGPKLDKQAAKHEVAQGRPELARRILENAGEAALLAAGGLRAVAGSSAARDIKPDVKPGVKPASKPKATEAADVKPVV